MSIRPCKHRKIKCDEERPKCQNCARQGETCDYSIRLNWEGRSKRKSNNEAQTSSSFTSQSLHRESSISTISDGGSTIRGQSPNPVVGFMERSMVAPTLPVSTIPSHRHSEILSRLRSFPGSETRVQVHTHRQIRALRARHTSIFRMVATITL